VLSETPFYDFVCKDPVWDKQRALDVVHHFSTVFLLDALKGDADARKALLDGVGALEGVEYQTTLR
jgi:hypothetical protein